MNEEKQAFWEGGPLDGMVRSWDRALWGVEFTGSLKGDPPMLIGALWASDLGGAPYPGEPTRALLFCTREQARAWCTATLQKWGNSRDDTLRRWRVRAVRVRETVQVQAPNV